MPSHRRSTRTHSSKKLNDSQRLTIAVALRFLQEAWENEIQTAADEKRAPYLRSRGEIFGLVDLLTPAEIACLSTRFVRSRRARIAERWTIVQPVELLSDN